MPLLLQLLFFLLSSACSIKWVNWVKFRSFRWWRSLEIGACDKNWRVKTILSDGVYLFSCVRQSVETVLGEIISLEIRSDARGAQQTNYYTLYRENEASTTKFWFRKVQVPVIARQFMWRKHEICCTVNHGTSCKIKQSNIGSVVSCVVADALIPFLLFLVTKIQP